MALILDVEIEESISIGSAVITLIHKAGRKARISIDADKSIPVQLIKPARKPTKDNGGMNRGN